MIEVPTDGIIYTVDDNEADRVLFQVVLKRSKVKNEVVAFESGESLVKRMREIVREKERGPAVILLDVKMPGMTGFDVLEFVRSQPQFEVLPVVCMLSSSDAEEDRDRAMAMGADAFVSKPSGLKAYDRFIEEMLVPVSPR